MVHHVYASVNCARVGRFGKDFRPDKQQSHKCHCRYRCGCLSSVNIHNKNTRKMKYKWYNHVYASVNCARVGRFGKDFRPDKQQSHKCHCRYRCGCLSSVDIHNWKGFRE